MTRVNYTYGEDRKANEWIAGQTSGEKSPQKKYAYEHITRVKYTSSGSR